MRTSSTNSIMIGIALCDLTVLSDNVFERVNSYWLMSVDNLCVNHNTYWYEMCQLIGDVLRTFCERASFWLGVFLALIRLLIMKVPGNPKVLSKPILGYILVLVLLPISLSHSLYYYSGYTIEEWGYPWRPGKE
uniref:G_PROTEIN_RECEP_F1_2 domain-containing protein n=1 Tax=Caenorhabditis tropicalis TaxID=1561998 RepID=A0A1I7V2H3_9PELO